MRISQGVAFEISISSIFIANRGQRRISYGVVFNVSLLDVIAIQGMSWAVASLNWAYERSPK